MAIYCWESHTVHSFILLGQGLTWHGLLSSSPKPAFPCETLLDEQPASLHRHQKRRQPKDHSHQKDWWRFEGENVNPAKAAKGKGGGGGELGRVEEATWGQKGRGARREEEIPPFLLKSNWTLEMHSNQMWLLPCLIYLHTVLWRLSCTNISCCSRVPNLWQPRVTRSGTNYVLRLDPSILAWCKTVFTWISAAALIKFSTIRVRRLFKGGTYFKDQLISHKQVEERQNNLVSD